LKASSKKTTLEFVDTSVKESVGGVGGYIDAVSVTPSNLNDDDHHRMDK